QDVDAAEPGECLIGHRTHARLVAHVRPNEQGLAAVAADRRDDALRLLLAGPVRDHDVRTLARERHGDARADARRASVDDREPSLGLARLAPSSLAVIRSGR